MSAALLTLFDNLNPAPASASPYSGYRGGTPVELEKGTATVYSEQPGNAMATRLLAANPGRRSCYLQNVHATIAVAIGFDPNVTYAAASAEPGWVLPPLTSMPFVFDRYTGEVWAIAASGTGDVRAIEIVA